MATVTRFVSFSIWEETEFSLLFARAFAGVAHLHNDSSLFMGGLFEIIGEALQTTELLDLTGSGQGTQGPDLPDGPNKFLCGSSLNSTHAFMGTGLSTGFYIKPETYLLELGTGEWIQLDDLPAGGRWKVNVYCVNLYVLFNIKNTHLTYASL